MSATKTRKAAPSVAKQHHGLELGERLFNAHAVLRAVVHQLQRVERGTVSDAESEVHDAGRALRLAAATVHEVAGLLSCCEVTAETADVQVELQALHVNQRGAIE